MLTFPTCTLPSGQVLSLRKFTADDFEAVHAYATDPLVYQYTLWGPNSPEQTQTFINEAMAEDPANLQLAVALDGTVIGAGAVWATNTEHDCGELGYTLNRAYWGRGYATLVAGFLRDLGFGTLGLHRIEATCSPENHGSRRVLEKTGFTYEGRLREHKLVRSQRRDSLVFSRLATD
ncbi:GNAT family N-acetyltransferase [Glutamicibacter sp. NPDC087344]|uniref:GNAT family N-acetyltransferase n=1 Tax=Glutamicibacter sp. NPDC087344 TaxID=3363994 RepID=UPI003816CDE7